MKNYVLKYRGYAAAALVAAAVYSLFTGKLRWEMFFISLCTMYLLRTVDDIMDYDTDGKEKFLEKKQMQALAAGLAAAFVLLHVGVFQLPGLISLLLLGYLVLMNHWEGLKLLLLPLLTVFYMTLYLGWKDARTIILVSLSLLLSAVYFCYKTGRRKKAE